MDRVLGYLSALLLTRLRITQAQSFQQPGGFALPEALVPTPRLLLVRAGELRYTVEGRTFRLAAPAMLLVAGHVRRRWEVPRGRSLDLAWVEFQPAGNVEPPASHLLLDDPDAALEQACFERIRGLHVLEGEAHRLRAEGELKAVLARFLARARLPTRSIRGREQRRRGGGAGGRGVDLATAWLGAHYASPEALAGLHERAHLSPNHFRLLFRRHLGLSPRRFLTVLRLRAARALLRESGLTVKEVAHASGFADPLYFSRLYRRFWGLAPTQDRSFCP